MALVRKDKLQIGKVRKDMVDLIASDIDYTLLQGGQTEISPSVLEVIGKLADRGVMFVASSGRQYSNLKRLFAPVADKISYICENGALIMYKDQVVAKFPIERNLGTQMMADIWDRGKCEILLSGMYTSYLFPKTREYVYYIQNRMKNDAEIVHNVAEVEEDFLKISIYNKQGIEEWSDYFIKRWGTLVRPVITGKCWLDFNSREVSKGKALTILQDLFDVTEDKTMSFGDNYSDLGMFKHSYFSYAMSGAPSEVRAQARYVTPTVESILLDVLRMII